MAACRLRFLALALPLAVVACASGCVQRRMMIVTDPPGALAYVDGYEIGVTPISASFTYYGSREIRLVKDGYETLTVLQPVQFPWYECFPLDFVSENLVPGQIHDQHVFSYKLRPQMVVPDGAVDVAGRGLAATSAQRPARHGGARFGHADQSAADRPAAGQRGPRHRRPAGLSAARAN